MATDVKIPTLGESVSEATVAEWLKKAGDMVALDEPIASLETDKVAVELTAPVAGILTDIVAAVGATVKIGAVVAHIDDKAKAAPATKAAVPTPSVAKPASDREKPQTATSVAAVSQAAAANTDTDMPMAPAVRRMVEEYNLNPKSITGSGKDGRLTKDDVLLAIEKGTAKTNAAVAVAGATAPIQRLEERVKMSRLRQTIARRLKEAQNTAAMLTTFNDVDMTAVMAARAHYRESFEKKYNVRLGFMSFFVKACALALRDVPAVNAAIEGDEIVYHKYADIGVAVSAPQGLVVPILKNADGLSFAACEKAIGDFGKRAKEGQLKLEELQGGTFTITNGGVFGSLMSTPIINPPQAAILGLHRIEDRPVVLNGQIVARPMMYLALSYDHRIIDGREAVMFLTRVKEAIADPTCLLLDL